MVALAWLGVAACSALSGLDDFQLETDDGPGSTTSTGGGGAGGDPTGPGGMGGGTGGQGGAGGAMCMPTQEICGNGVDENCNGLDDDADGAVCVLMDSTPPSLVVRYHIDEATSGTAPMELVDAAQDPVALSVDYGNGDPLGWNDLQGHLSLQWADDSLSGLASAAIDGTKIHTRLDGQTAATIEVVVDISSVAAAGSPISYIGVPGATGLLGLRASSDQLADAVMNDVQIGAWAVDFPQEDRSVLHLVIDTEASAPEDIVRFYLNGNELPEEEGVGAPPAAGATLALGSGASHILGNLMPSSGNPARSFGGRLYYSAIYAAALTAEQVRNNAIVLLANDDTPPAQ